MYLVSQMASYLFATFLLGIGVGYALWRSWGEREVIARFNSAEMRLAAHIARLEQAAAQPDPFARGNAQAQRGQPPARLDDDGGAQAAQARLDQRWEETARRELHDFEMKQAALMREAEDAAIRKAEAAAERKLADLAGKYGYDMKAAGGAAPREPEELKRREPNIALVEPAQAPSGLAAAAAVQRQTKSE
jgi:hypothetical protein